MAKNNSFDFNGKDSMLRWSLTASGTLEIKGAGRMPDFSCDENEKAPWMEQRKLIRKVSVGEGITEIGLRAFEGCVNLRAVQLPSTLARIHAYAFKNCTSLNNITAKKGAEFQYIYEPARTGTKQRAGILFGVESFYGVPWAVKSFGEFYHKNGILYTCFSGEDHLTVPEGIHTLHDLALRDAKANTVFLPDSLRVIGRFAFAGAQVKSLTIPAGVESIEENAFADSSLELLEFSAELKCELGTGIFERTTVEFERYRDKRYSFYYYDADKGWQVGTNIRRVPVAHVRMPNIYQLGLVSDRRNFGDYKKIRVERKKPLHHRDGSISGIYGKDRVNVGSSICRRLRAGSIVTGITYDEKRVICVRSYAWSCAADRFMEYEMYVRAGENGPEISEDFLTYCEKEKILSDFPDTDAHALINSDALRSCPEGVREDWFLSRERGGFGKMLELKLLRYWMKKHPVVLSSIGNEALSARKGRKEESRLTGTERCQPRREKKRGAG